MHSPRLALPTLVLITRLCQCLARTPHATSLTNKHVTIIGAGPSSLFLANILLQQDPTVNIQILEKKTRDGTADDGAFGFGIGSRHEITLAQIPGMWEQLKEVSAPTKSGNVNLIRRNDLCDKLRSRLEDKFSARCNILYETKCVGIEFEQDIVSLENGSKISYDLLVGADGVNSMVRAAIKKDDAEYYEEHYVRPMFWKAMKLPDQNGNVDPGTFRMISGGGFSEGAMIPRYPEGHTILVFWDHLDLQNPKGVRDEKDLLNAFMKGLHAKKPFFQRLISFGRKKTDEKLQIQFDEEELTRFLKGRAGREHTLKLAKYHHSGNVALIGDAAHAMYSILGQGAACGFLTASILGSHLAKEKDVSEALKNYSEDAVPEANAIVDLNLVIHALTGGILIKLATVPMFLLSALRGSNLFKDVGGTKSYQEVLRKNRFLIWVCKKEWKRTRIPVSSTIYKLD